ncbi:MAG: SO_0444 family Cu/Zn efflux transporter [Candidatus Binatia bacterium]
MEFLTTVLSEIARVFYEGSLYILVGFLVAGLLHEFLPTDTIARHLGGERPRSVLLAALFGAPIPLCSCGVLPAAAALRRKGAGRSSLMSFLISTPETGVDSIALTYGLMGPVMAVVRPVVAIVTGVVAGLISIALGDDDDDTAADATSCDGQDPDHDHGPGEECSDLPGPSTGSYGRMRGVVRYGFTTLLDEIAFWIVIGIGLTGLIAAMIPDDFFSAVLGWESGLIPMLAMVLAGLPLYLCASASTPVAAALVLKGLSPGAALVFLLVGPATNAATITVVGRLLGGRRLRVYLGSLIAVSLAAGLLLDMFAADAVRATTLAGGPERDSRAMFVVKASAALIFLALIAASFVRTRFREGMADVRDQVGRLATAIRDFHPRDLLTPPVLGSAAVVLTLATVPAVMLVVEPGERGIVQRFGRVVDGNRGPGLHFHLPAPFGRGTSVATARLREVTVGYRVLSDGIRDSLSEQSFYLTADENIIDVRSVVVYRVDDPVRFALGIEQADELIRSLARRELVATTSRRPIDTLYTTDRAPTERQYRAALAARIAERDIGCELVDARLLDVHAPSDVHDAFRDVASALEDREREIDVARGYAAEAAAEARGAAAAAVSGARAAATRSVLLAGGEAAAFDGIATEHARNPVVTETRLYLEALEASIAESKKYVHSSGPSGGDIDLWLGDGTAPVVVPPGVNNAGGEPQQRQKREKR